MKSKLIKAIFPLTALSVLLTACGGGDSASGGHFSLGIGDAPVDEAAQVVVRFNQITLHSPQGEDLNFVFCANAATFTRAQDCAAPQVLELDLLALSGAEARALLDNVEVPAGAYPWLRLAVDEQNPGYLAALDGSRYPLAIPSGAESGLKLNRGFTIAQGGRADFTIDFDLRKSVHEQGHKQYKLRPTLRLLDNSSVGSVQGTVSVAPGCSPAVYAFSGTNAVADDLGSAGEPLVTAPVKLDNQSGQYRYRINYLETGQYTLAFTCQASADDPAQDDALTFLGSATANVDTRGPATVDLQ